MVFEHWFESYLVDCNRCSWPIKLLTTGLRDSPAACLESLGRRGILLLLAKVTYDLLESQETASSPTIPSIIQFESSISPYWALKVDLPAFSSTTDMYLPPISSIQVAALTTFYLNFTRVRRKNFCCLTSLDYGSFMGWGYGGVPCAPLWPSIPANS